ncbi:MAG: ABC transporter ATP-binding protein [Bacteroidota bacterium]
MNVQQISKTYGERTVLHPLDLSIRSNEQLAIIGETGSGKTTLLRALAGLLDLTSGEITFRGERVVGPSEQLLPGHTSISYLNQAVHLRNHYKVKDLLERHSIQEEHADWALAKLCRIELLMHRMTDQLSGGERQRIALAIELSKHPAVLLLDEPFSNLDMGHRHTLRSVLDDLNRQQGMTIVIVSHNPSEILGWADRVIVMRKGKCVQVGTPRDIYEMPADEYVAQLLGQYNRIERIDEPGAVIIRPERISFVPMASSSHQGLITYKEFEGATYLYSVRVDEEMYFVRTGRADLQVGQKVGIFIDLKQSS